MFSRDSSNVGAGETGTQIRTGQTPAFYALQAGGSWRDYVNLLHVPYTLWHLSYVVLGAAIASSIHLDRLLGTLLAFFLAVGICAHALDELNGRPLRTRIPAKVLVALAAASLAGAVGLGIFAGIVITPWIFPFVASGAFIAVAYNLGLWRNKFHSDVWFALSWGAFPALTSYWINSLDLNAAAILMACGCFALSLAQRTLSTQVRNVRRNTLRIDGTIRMADGATVTLDSSAMLQVPEQALRLLSMTIVVFAVSVLTSRL